MKWECCSECKVPTKLEVDVILALKEDFQKPMNDILNTFHTCDDGCPNQHYTKLVSKDDTCSFIDLKGHPLVCYDNETQCHSKLRILRAVSTHYPVLRNFLHGLYSGMKHHMYIATIDNALSAGDFHSLMEITNLEFHNLFSTNVEEKYEQHTETVAAGSMFRDPNLESHLMTTYAKLMIDLDKEIDDYPEHVCCSCERLHQRKSVTLVSLSDNLGSEVWPRLKNFITQNYPAATDQELFMCNYCKALVKKDKLPPRCVLNGLQTVPIPSELSKLDSLSTQLIQRAKSYQTIVRLGTYTAKVPIYNSLKACKGTMFYLPLPLNKTLETLDEVRDSSKVALPNPELYVIVNGKPTKGKVVWRNLVNVNQIKTAVEKLTEINWLYKNVDDESVDEAAKHVVEVVNNTSSTMLEKATKEDIVGFQSYTIRNLDNKLSTESDIDQYKVKNVQEDPLDNRQKYLDVMCFPVLFPTGHFGKYHPREVKLSHSEYVKSRLLNKDSRFRKDPQYVFYLLWQKEMRELSAGVYNVLKCTKSRPMSVSSLLNRVDNSDEGLEANLCTMLQSVRGTKQYWFIRQSELRCMIRGWGSPTIFLTLSCAEYESPDITTYLRKVNDVPSSYNIGKLCTEDPIFFKISCFL